MSAAIMQDQLEEEEELMRDVVPEQQYQPEENLEDEFMEEEEEEEDEEDEEEEFGNKVSGQEMTGDTLAFERGLQRMRELNRRHGSQNYSGVGSATGSVKYKQQGTMGSGMRHFI